VEEEIDLYLTDAEETMGKALAHTASELGKIRAGKASPSMVDGLRVDYYGSATPIGNMATVSVPDARSLIIKPFEKQMVGEIMKAIKNSDLGLNPLSEADQVRLNIPPLTEQRRRDLAKQAKNETENGKVAIRNIRKETNEDLRKLLKEGASEDAIKAAEAEVQKLTDAHIARLDQAMAKKEAEIMTI
jgi:ribosome recycling factor